jgi:PAS domain S-box-containing protein
MGTWWFDPPKRVFGWSPQTVALLGLPAEQTATGIGEWRDYIHPDDQADAKAGFEAVLRRGGDYEAEFRVRRPDGLFRWINTRGRVYLDAAGQASHMVGILHDVTARKEAEEQQRVLLGELNHRVKNTLATVQSIARQTLRASEPALFGEAFERRLLALSKTHDLLTRNAWREADFSAIVEQELMPYRRETNDRILVSGPEVLLPARTAINLGLVLHELVTNAAKYGALSVPSGRLELTWRVAAGSAGGPDLVVSWRESGGPAIAEPRRQGFGSRLIERSIEGELGGRIKLEYLSAGLVGLLEIPLSQALARQAELDRQDVPIAV